MKPKGIRNWTIRPVENGFVITIEFVGKTRKHIAASMDAALWIVKGNYTELINQMTEEKENLNRRMS